MVLSIILIFVIGLFAYRRLTVELLNRSQSVKFAVESYIIGATNLLDTMATFSENDPVDDMGDLFHSALESYPYFDAFYYLDPNGEVLILSPQNSSDLGLDMSGQDFYHSAQIIPDVVITQPFISWRSGHPTVYLAQDTNNDYQVVAELDLSSLQTAISADQDTPITSRDTIVFITDSYGNLIAHPDLDLVMTQTRWDGIDIIQTPQAQSAIILFNNKGEYELLSAADIRGTGWYVVTMTPLATLIRPYAIAMLLLISISIVILVIVLQLFMRRFQMYVSEPLTQLSKMTHTISQGEYLLNDQQQIQDIPVIYDELETLKEDFSSMNDALQKRENALRSARDELQVFNEQLEERVSERTKQLESAIQEIESFSYSVSHDLRAPLRHVNGYTQLLIDGYADTLDENGLFLLKRAHQASERMAELIDALLTLSRISRNEMRLTETNLSQIANDAISEIKNEQPDRKIFWDIEPDIIVCGDPTLLRVAISNLLSNAWKFTSYTKNAKVEVGHQENDETGLVYFVRDNGAGFDMAYSDKLFGAFQRLHSESEFEGTGIGLALVQRVIHRHKGDIWAESSPDKGATFYFTLGT